MPKKILRRITRIADKATSTNVEEEVQRTDLLEALAQPNTSETVGHLVDGVIKHWGREYEILVSKAGKQHHITIRNGDAELCHRVKRDQLGRSLCSKCEEDHSTQSASANGAVAFTCHAGVNCITAPIIVEGTHLASIFLGEHLVEDPQSLKKSRNRTARASKLLGIPKEGLLTRLDRLHHIDNIAFEALRKRISILARKLGSLETERREARRESYRICAESLLFQIESKVIQEALPALAEIGTLEKFWPKLSVALAQISQVIGATLAAFFTSNELDPETFSLMATSGIDKAKLRKQYSGNNFSFWKIAKTMTPRVLDFDPTPDNTLCHDLAAFSDRKIDKVALIPFELSANRKAMMIFLLSEEEDEKSSLPIDAEAAFLARFAPQISIAYQNCELYSEKLRSKEEIGENLAHKKRKLAEKQEELDRLGEVGEALTKGVELKDALEFIALTAATITAADIVTIIPYDQRRHVFDIDMAACYGIDKKSARLRNQPRTDGTLTAIRESGVLFVDDTSAYTQFPFLKKDKNSFVRRQKIRSFIGARLHVGEEDVGVLYINFRTATPFVEEQREAVIRLASHAAPSIKAARSAGDSLRHIFELSTLNEIGTELNLSTAFNRQNFFEMLYRQTSRLMSTENFYVASFHKKEKITEFGFAYEDNKRCSVDQGEWCRRIDGNGMTEYVIRSRKPTLVNHDVREWMKKNSVESFGREAKSWLGAPMIAGGQVVGVIGVQSYEREYAYDENHKNVLATIASQAASALRIRNLLSERNKTNRVLQETKSELEKMMVETFTDTGNRFAGKLFYDTVSHDLRNFVTATESTLEQLLEGPKIGHLPKTFQRKIKKLIERTQKSSDTIESFIGIAGDFKPELEFHDLNAIVRQVLDLQANSIEESEIKLKEALDERIPRIQINALQITMVIFNLTVNAIKAIRRVSRPGILKLTTRRSKDGGRVRLVVEDNGCGIHKDDISRIFEPYFSGKGSSGGSGLGLFGCREIIKSLGGTIGINSRFGKGSSFVVEFPSGRRPSRI